MSRVLATGGSGDKLWKVGMQPHVAIFGLENVRQLVEHFQLWDLVIYRVVLICV